MKKYALRATVVTTLLAAFAGLSVVHPPNSPAVTAGAEPTYPVMNTSEAPPDGVWFRNSPRQGDTNRETGHGVYMGESVRVTCFAFGDAVGSYGNTVWYLSTNLNRTTINGHPNSGYLNTHYVSDGMTAGNPAPGIPQCGADTDGGANEGTGDTGGGSNPQITLRQKPGTEGSDVFSYDISLTGFAPGATVTLTCHDSVDPGGFRTFSRGVPSSGSDHIADACYSGDGPEYWVSASNGAVSNRGTRAPGGGTGGAGGGGGGGGESGEEESEDPPKLNGTPCALTFSGGRVTSHAVFGGRVENYDRVQSLLQWCEGFGAPTGITFSPAFMCAMIATQATLVAPLPQANRANAYCAAASIAADIEKGDWINVGGSLACGLFSELLASGGAVTLAGATSPTGPGAAVVGANTYRAIKASMDLACAGIFDGGAYDLGYRDEERHLHHVAMDVAAKGKCLQMKTVFGYLSWSAVNC